MPVQVQLPGYNHAVPAAGLASLVNSGMGIYEGLKKTNLEAAQQKNEELKNQALESGTNQNLAYQKALQDPNSVETKTAKAGASALLSGLSDAGVFKSPDGKVGLAQLNGLIQDPNTSGFQVHQTFEQSPVLKALTGLGEAKLKGDANITGAQVRAAPQNVRNQSQANAQYQTDLKPIEGTISAANRVDGIIDKIKGGGLKSTPTLSTDLSNALASMFNNGKAATVSGTEHANAGLNSLEGTAAGRYGYVAGQPMNTVAPEQLDQLQKDVRALRDEYSYAHKAAFDSFVEGLDPSLRPGLQNRFNKFRQSSVNTSYSKQEEEKKQNGPPVDADLSKMTTQQLQDYVNIHGK